MSIHCALAVLVLVMALHGQGYTWRIIDGQEAVPHSRPYMVLVKKDMDNGATYFCGGFLINEDFVMTAAHCYGRKYTVYLGVHDTNKINDDVQQRSVVQSFPHKDYNKTRYTNDMMLLKLGSSVSFNVNIQPIKLAEHDDKSLPKSCMVCGWGQADNGNKGMCSKLMEVNITLINNTSCEKLNFYCSEGVPGPREGDSGGPLVCKGGIAYGVVSAMVNSSGHILYTYIKIPDYKDWILSIIKNNID